MMKGKAKEQFVNWYLENKASIYTYQNFKRLPVEFKWGVYQAFADSKGIDIDALCRESVIELRELSGFRTRPEAQIEAIKQLSNYINSEKPNN